MLRAAGVPCRPAPSNSPLLRRAALVVLAVPVWAACHVYWFLAPVLLLTALAVLFAFLILAAQYEIGFVTTIDGRETAPAAMESDAFIDPATGAVIDPESFTARSSTATTGPPPSPRRNPTWAPPSWCCRAGCT